MTAPSIDPNDSQEMDSFGEILKAMRRVTPRDPVPGATDDSQSTDNIDSGSPPSSVAFPALPGRETAPAEHPAPADPSMATRTSKRLLGRSASLFSIPPAGQVGPAKPAKPTPRLTVKPPAPVLPKKAVAATQATQDSAPTPSEVEDPEAEAPAKKRRKSAHVCQAGTVAAEMAALKEEVHTLSVVVQELAGNLKTSQSALKDLQYYVDDIKSNHEPLLKMSDKIKSLDIEIRDTQGMIGDGNEAQLRRHNALVDEIRPIFATISAFMDGVRPALTTMGNFMAEARPRMEQLGTQGQDLRRLEDTVRAATSRLTELEDATTDTRSLAKRPRLSLAPELGNAFTTTTPLLFPQAPSSTMTATPYPSVLLGQSNPQTLAQGALTAGAPVSAPMAPAVQPQSATQNGVRPGWAVKLGPINLNGASVRDVLRSMFNPLPGGSNVLRNLGDPILTDNMDHITGRVRTRQAAHDLAHFWNTGRKHPYLSVQAHVMSGN